MSLLFSCVSEVLHKVLNALFTYFSTKLSGICCRLVGVLVRDLHGHKHTKLLIFIIRYNCLLNVRVTSTEYRVPTDATVLIVRVYELVDEVD